MINVSLQNLDLTAGNRRLIHEGALTWKIQYSKKIVGECEECTYVL